MKHIFLPILIILSLQAYCQDYCCYEINFDDEKEYFRFLIDTNTNSKNIWQIGIPQKSFFIEAFSSPNVIATDLISPYPVNDTSSFIIKHIAGQGYTSPHTVSIYGYYWVNSDTLSDYGSIEFSPDNGITWVDLINDTILRYDDYIYVGYGEPVLTGNSDGWKEFSFQHERFGPYFNIDLGDTVLYKFTFISDNNQTNKDGLMFDNLYINDWAEGIDDFKFERINSKVYPNPSNSTISIEFDNPKYSSFKLIIYDNLGRQVIVINKVSNNEIIINAKEFNPGLYFYSLTNILEQKRSWGKFIIEDN